MTRAVFGQESRHTWLAFMQMHNGRCTTAPPPFLANFRFLPRYNRWFNDRLYGACEQLPDAERWRDRGAFFRFHNLLDALKFVPGNHRLVGADVRYSTPHKRPRVKRVGKNVMGVAASHFPPILLLWAFANPKRGFQERSDVKSSCLSMQDRTCGEQAESARHR